MMDPRFAVYGSLHGMKPSKMAQYSTTRSRPALPVLIGCLFVPWLLFITTFWLRSFELRKDSDVFATLLCYCLLLPVLAFAWMTFNLMSAGSADPKPMAFLAVTSLLAWVVAFQAGDSNYKSFMRPFYDYSNLNVYPSVDPSKYTGNQLMDAGMIQFTKGSTVQISKSIGFKNDDVYCVAPIVASANSTPSTYDFWAVGLNCCSGHMADFRCGEYSNPSATWGLRLMDDSKRDMFRLAVMQASASFNLNASHPVFVYWLSDPHTEVSAYEDDGFRFFLMWVFGSFAAQLFLVVCAMCMTVKM